MPTLYHAQLTEKETPWVEIWDGMYQGLVPHARPILDMLGYYAERDLQIPDAGIGLTPDEVQELEPIGAALTSAAVETQKMPDGVLIATLTEVAKGSSCISAYDLPGAVQWELANDHQRGEERPGTFPMDIWGSEQTFVPYVWGEPTHEIVARDAARALGRIQQERSVGRRMHPAHPILADGLGNIFRASGQPIVRHRRKIAKLHKHTGNVLYEETGPFHEFLELVLRPLNDFLRERRLPPVTIDSVVRLTVETRPRRPSLPLPSFSHNEALQTELVISPELVTCAIQPGNNWEDFMTEQTTEVREIDNQEEDTEPQTEAIPEDNTDYMPDFIQKMVDDPPILPGESAHAFRGVFTSFEWDYTQRPKTDWEYQLTSRAAVAAWELMRYDRMKAAILRNHQRHAAESMHRRSSGIEPMSTLDQKQIESYAQEGTARYFTDPAYRAEFAAHLERSGFAPNGVEGEAFLRALPSLSIVDRLITSTEKRLDKILRQLDAAYAKRHSEQPMPQSIAARRQERLLEKLEREQESLTNGNKKADSGK